MIDIILVCIILGIAAGALMYVHKRKKDGGACPGCSHKACPSHKEAVAKIEQAANDSSRCDE